MKLPIVVLLAVAIGCGIGAAMARVAVGPMDIDQLALPPEPLGPDGSPAGAAPTARVEVDEVTHDFGIMQRGAKKSHVFQLTNTGKAPLRIEVLGTSCKCTVGEVENEPILPGQSAPVKLEWVAKALVGPFRQTAELKTNDPYNSVVTLTVEGEVTDVSALEPREFVLGRVGVDQGAEASVVFMAYDQDELELSAVAPSTEESAGRYEVSVTPLEKADLPDERATAGARIDLRLLPGAPVGVFTEWVPLTTNLPSMPEIQVPLYGRVVGDLTILGYGWSEENGVLTLGFVKSDLGKKAKLRVSVTNAAAADTILEVADVDPPELQVTLGETKLIREGYAHVPLTVEVPQGCRPMVRLQTGPKPDGTYQHPEGTILLKSNLERTPEIRLRVRFAVEGGGR